MTTRPRCAGGGGRAPSGGGPRREPRVHSAAHRVRGPRAVCLQVALTCTQIWWTTEVGLAFARLEEGYENAIKDYNKKQVWGPRGRGDCPERRDPPRGRVRYCPPRWFCPVPASQRLDLNFWSGNYHVLPRVCFERSLIRNFKTKDNI